MEASGQQDDAEHATAAARALQEVRPSLREELQDSLTRMGSGGRWLRTLFLLGCLPGILNGAHLVAYVFLANEPEFWCAVPELSRTRWSPEEVRNISAATSCSYLAWNYTALADLPFAEAQDQVSSTVAPVSRPCHSYVFVEPAPSASIVSEWSLVCDNAPLRSTAQVALAVGKILGSIIFGCISDRMGRKTSFVAASLVYLVAGPAASFSYHYSAFLFFRVALGAAGTGTFFSAFTILTESTPPLKRPTFGVLFNMSYPLGFLALPVAALVLSSWRALQLAISLPALLLVLPCWFLPESPRWLLAQGRVTETMHVLRLFRSHKEHSSGLSVMGATLNEEPQQEHTACWAGTGAFLTRVLALLRHTELRRRLALLSLCWFACALTYHSLALSGHTFLQQPHQYVALLGAVELLAYLAPPLLLRVMGRRSTVSMLLVGTAAALLPLLALPTEWRLGVLAAAMVARIFVSAAYAVVALYTTELFPTVGRGTAIGSCTTVAQIASIAAPYMVDLLGSRNPSIPSALCAVSAAVASLVVLALPETQNLPLCETVAQVQSDPDEV